MYVAGLVIPVPEDKLEAYRQWAENGARFFMEYGCLEIVESGRTSCPTARRPTFAARSPRSRTRRLCSPGRSGPTRRSFNAAEEKMHQDPRMETAGEPPFDARRLILGCFQPIVSTGRDA